MIKMLGNGRLEALCFDGSKRLANVSSPPNTCLADMFRNGIMTGYPSLQ